MSIRGIRRLFLPALVVFAVSGTPTGAAHGTPPNESWTTIQEAVLDIRVGDRVLGTESLRIYQSGDTTITSSTVRLDGAGPESALPLEKRLTYLRRRIDSFPLAFRVSETPRDTSRGGTALNCILRDTVATVFLENDRRGQVETVRLPPGKVYLLEPGVYLPVQLLLADFVAGSQEKRKQPVLIPSVRTVVDVHLTRIGRDTILVAGRRIPTTRVGMTDKLTSFTAWLDDEGRMWRLTADGQDLVVQRRPDPVAKKPTAQKSGSRKASAKPH